MACSSKIEIDILEYKKSNKNECTKSYNNVLAFLLQAGKTIRPRLRFDKAFEQTRCRMVFINEDRDRETQKTILPDGSLKSILFIIRQCVGPNVMVRIEQITRTFVAD
jgi:hypothetical protein